MVIAFDIAEARGGGLLLASDLADLGVTSRTVRIAMAANKLVRVRRGVYARPPVNRPFWPGELHALRVRGTAPLVNHDYVVSHLSAAAMHGLPIIGAWPDVVHVRLAGAQGGSSSPGIVRHRTPFCDDVLLIDGVRVTTVARTLIDVASTATFAAAVTAIDFALRTALVSHDELISAFERGHRGRGAQGAVQCIRFGDGRSGSPGESLSRVRTFELGFDRPQLQWAVRTAAGEFDVDFRWSRVRRLGEFDGLVKYTRALFMQGKSIDQVVVEEKRREDAIRAETTEQFSRWLWSDALNPALFARILRDAGVPSVRGLRSLASWVTAE